MKVASPLRRDADKHAPPALRARRRAARGVVPSRLRRPLPLVGVCLVLLSLLGFWSVYRETTGRTPVLVAARHLNAGHTLAAADVRAVEVAGERSLLDVLVPEALVGEVVGRRLSVALPAGVPISRPLFAAAAATPPSIVLAVPSAQASGLAAGDRVTVLATFGRGTGSAHARVVARGLVVLAVARVADLVDPTGSLVPVTVALNELADATAVALASSEAALTLLRDGSRRSTVTIPPASEQERP